MKGMDRKYIAAEQIRQAMEYKGISRKQLADRMGKSPSEVTRWLSGSHNFTIGLLAQISEELDAEISGIERSSVCVDGYANNSEMTPATLEDPVHTGRMTLRLPASCLVNLGRRASRSGMNLETYVQQVLIADASKASVRAIDFCGVWGDEDFPPAEEMSEMLKSLRTSNKMPEL